MFSPPPRQSRPPPHDVGVRSRALPRSKSHGVAMPVGGTGLASDSPRRTQITSPRRSGNGCGGDRGPGYRRGDRRKAASARRRKPESAYCAGQEELCDPYDSPRNLEAAHVRFEQLRYRGNASGVEAEPLAHMHGGLDTFCAPGVGEEPMRSRSVPKSRNVRDNFVNRVLQQCGPAVVRVNMESKVKVSEENDVFSMIFGGGKSSPREKRVAGHGSGFCVDGEMGLIVTNAHVVKDVDRITVTFAGQSPLECEVLELDEVIDLAALRVTDRHRPRRLPDMPLGSSESVMSGDWAIVLGSPLGLANTCTLGIISSLERSTGETGFDWMRHPLFQTDAAVNQGNSGGPLLNESGEVIGMIGMRALMGEGIGFATPSDSIREALQSLIRGKKVPRAYLGIRMVATHPSSPDRRQGAFVDLVLPRSPAEQAGFRPGDEIVEADGRPIHRFDEVQRLVRSLKVGSKMRLRVGRKNTSHDLVVTADDVKHLLRRNKEASASPNRGHVSSTSPVRNRR